MARIKCQNGTYTQFSIDPMTHLRLQYAKACTKHLTGMELSNSALVRAALRQYTDHLELLPGLDQDDPQRLYLSYSLKAATKGDTSPPEKLLDSLHQEPFPKLSDMLKEYQKGSQERIWDELKGSRFYVQALKTGKR